MSLIFFLHFDFKKKTVVRLLEPSDSAGVYPDLGF